MGNRRRYVRRDATVGKLSAIYLSDKTGKVKDSTLKCYQFNIRKYILPHLGSRVAAEMAVEDVDDYMEALLERYSPKLVREVASLLLAILRIAGVNFTGEVALPKVRQKAVEVFTKPELLKIGKTVLHRPDETGLGILLTAYTGIRLGELCGLQWQDVNVDAGTLHVQRTVERIAQAGGGTCLTVQTPKTESSDRWIPIPQEMLRILDAGHRQPEAYLLTGGETLPDPRTCQYRYKALLNRCGVGYRSFHALRHTFATHALTSGVDAKTLSGILGHTNASFTLDTYTHVTSDMQKTASGIVGGFMEDIFGKELKPWQENEKPATEP